MSKTILITGSTDGIGKLVAQSLAKEGHKIYVHGRSPEKLEATIEGIQQSSNNDNIKGFVADFSDLGAVKQMAQQILQEVPKIDVLINNAGVYNSPTLNNKLGLDMRLVVNFLAPYVLTNFLIPSFNKGARIINLSSAAQRPVDWDVLSGKAQASERETYAQSKLALTMWTFYLAKQLKDTNVIAVNPGSLLNTKMVKEAFGNHWSPAEKGADLLHDLAISTDYDGVTGKYFDNDKEAFGKAHPVAYDDSRIAKLMDITTRLTNGEKP
ncbi:MAG: SDR family NAD(P)-dependent oxidoreductase [Cyclobacteriaceae bacterium]